MNEQTVIFMRQTLLEGLNKCTDKQVLFFKRLYAGDAKTKSIEFIVSNMPAAKLDWAMQQVERTLKLNLVKNTQKGMTMDSEYEDSMECDVEWCHFCDMPGSDCECGSYGD